MQRLFELIKNLRYFMLFLLLETVGFALVMGQYKYHHSIMHTVTGDVFYSLSAAMNSWTRFFSLHRENDRLMEENARLRTLLSQDDKAPQEKLPYVAASTAQGDAYSYIPAEVIKNSTRMLKNYIVLDRGADDGVRVDDGVVTDSSVVGIIVQVSPHFSVCRSILHTDSYVSAKFKNNEYHGSVVWDGTDRSVVDMQDVSRVAEIHKGDTVTTDRRSALFPEGLMVGVVEDFSQTQSDFYDIKLRLKDDFEALRRVYIIRYAHKDELNEALEYE